MVKLHTPSNGGKQRTNYLTEADLYRLIVHSKLPKAEAFEKWVFEDVLPTVRRTGKYGSKNQNPPKKVYAIANDRERIVRIDKMQKQLIGISSMLDCYNRHNTEYHMALATAELIQNACLQLLQLSNDNVNLKPKTTTEIVL